MKFKKQDDYIFWSLILTFALLLTFFLIYKFILSSFITFPDCSIYKLTGFYCPGCGSTRSFLALLDFNLVTSFLYNPTVIYSAFIVILYMFFQIIDRILKKEKFFMPFHNIYIYIGLFVFIINWIVRNILLYFYDIYI